MKILLITDDFPPAGQSSVAIVTEGLVAGYRAAGHEVHILTAHDRATDPQIQQRDRVTSLPANTSRRFAQYRSLYQPRMSRMVFEETRKIAPDVVHIHNVNLRLTYDAIRQARRVTPKVFVTLHDVMSFSSSRLATKQYLKTGGRDARLSAREDMRLSGFGWNPLRRIWILSILHNNAKGVIAVSEALARAAKQNHVPVSAAIPNGIDLSQWTPDSRTYESARTEAGLRDRMVVFFGGRLSIDKGAVPLLQALAQVRERYPHLLLLVAGEQRRWTGLLKRSGVSDDGWIRCTGWLDRPALKRMMAASDIVTTPSLCLDCFPQTNLEAMALAKPIIGTCFGGTPEAVLDGKTGIIVDPQNVTALAHAFERLIGNAAIAQEMGAHGRTRVEERFTVQHQAVRYLELFGQ